MVRMIYLSERLPVEENGLRENVDIFRWNRYPDIPRLSDYEIAVLDMKTTYGKYGGAFLGQREESQILLQSGGVIICLNYFTTPTGYQTTRDLGSHPASIKSRPSVRTEINYDWMFSVDLMSTLNVAQLDARIGKSFDLTSKTL